MSPLPAASHRASQSSTIPHLLREQATRHPHALALLSPGRAPLSYGGLSSHVDDVVQTLRTLGIDRHDRVALVLPNGPEMAVAFVVVASGATCAPLNPNYSANELEAHLADLHAKALIVQAGVDSPARTVAHAYGLSIIELLPLRTAEAGLFTLSGVVQRHLAVQSSARPDDVAVMLSTAGTTSRSKLVPLTHGNVCAQAYNTRMALDLVESDRCLNMLPLFHTYGPIGTLLTSLVAGASVVCTPGFSAPDFFAWMAEFRPTWYPAVPTMHQALLALADQHHETIGRCPLRFIRSGSAPLPPQVCAELERVFDTRVIETYGMTETSVITCNPPPRHPRKPGSVGMAIGLEVAIMDANGAVLPAGELGEIVMRGASVMQGYDNDPAANRRAFIQGWFRTGDQGVLDAEGYLFVTGRFTELINRGGENIAPWEVDMVLMEHPAVAQAMTFAVPHARLGEDIAAAVVLHPCAAVTAGHLRQFVATRLADFKVPRQIFFVADLPQGATGKLQRRALADYFGLMAPTSAQPEKDIDASAPRTPMEELLVELWTQVCDVESVGIHADFFQLGGDSLLATQLLSRVREATHVDIPFHTFFAIPTVAGMAEHIELAHRTTSRRQSLPLQPVSREQPLPLSYPQQRLWFIEQFPLSRPAYHLLEVMHLQGPLQVTLLQQGLQTMLQRHEVFRTTFENIAEQPFQVIGPASMFSLPVIDLQDLPEDEQKAQVHALAQAAVQQPFDLTQGPLLRATLVRLSSTEHVFLLTMHHIVSDGWSHAIFWRELALLYEAFATGQSLSLPILAIQYADFAYWQQQWWQDQPLGTSLAYWQQQLANTPALQLPTDHPRPVVQTFRGARHSLALSPALTQDLKMLSQRYGTTLFMTLLAVFQTLLHRYTGQNDIAVGSLVANRNRTELESLIGFFVNTLVLRTDLSGDPSFRELLARVRIVTLGAYEHQDVPYEKLLEALRPPREPGRNPLFQVMVVLHNTPQHVPDLPELTVCPLEIDPGTARFDLTFEFWETSEGLRGRCEYSIDLFEAATIVRMAAHFQTLLMSIVVDPEQRLSRLPLMTADECHRLLVEWNTNTAPYPDAQCIQEIFEAQVRQTPDAVALIDGEASLTYHDLNRRANQVAHYLHARGVGPEVLVGLSMERSLTMVIALLGILKAGAAYVPLDPTYPSGRLAFMVEDSRPPMVLTQKHLAMDLPAHGAELICLDADWPLIAQYSDANPRGGVAPDNLAYVLYTSGSTGRPKGVLGTHRATLNVLAWLWHAYPFTTSDVCCHKISMSFTDSIQELLAPLLQGIPTVLIPEILLNDLRRLVQTLARHRVSRLILVPSLLRALLDTVKALPDQLSNLRLWFVGGEVLSSELLYRFREQLPSSRLIHLYGASEASANTTWYDTSTLRHESYASIEHSVQAWPWRNTPCQTGGALAVRSTGMAPQAPTCVPIGRPLANTQVYVLDEHLQPVSIGVAGTLYVGGTGLTRGYLNHAELTAEHFIPHPFSSTPGERLYQTGDVVRYQPNGNIEYVGRLDHQVKIHGIRIELGEVEAALAQHPAVRETAVIVREDIPGELRLVAYVVPNRGPWPSPWELRHFLGQKLPRTMVPAIFEILNTFSLTPSGKVDRQALPPPDPSRLAREEPYMAPRTVIEQQLATLWCQLFHVAQVGIHDNFFELGGHSLLTIQLLSRVRDATHVEVSPANFFANPTVAGMAAIIEAADPTAQGWYAPELVPRQHPLPASIAQEQLWSVAQMLPNLPVFNISYVLRLEGILHVAVLEQSFNEILRRHEALRTTFTSVAEQLVQVIAPTMCITLRVKDLRALPEAERDSEAWRHVQEESQRPFDLAQGPLIRSCLLWLDEQEHLLLVTLHHIICDGWSLGVLVHELTMLYDAFITSKPPSLPELPIQYADFASWQRQCWSNASMVAQLAYWREQLCEPLPMLELPTDRPRGPTFPLHTARLSRAVPGQLVEALQEVGQQEGTTLFMVFLAAFKMLLYGYTGQEDLRVATLVANRTRQETEGLIGLLVNTVILRTNLGGNPTGREVLRRVHTTTLAAYAHQELPFEELLRTLESECHLRRRSLCQVMLVWHPTMQQSLPFSTHTLSFLEMDQSKVVPAVTLTTFEIILILHEGPQGLTGTCIYKTELFDAATISRMLDNFQAVLTCLSIQPEQALPTFGS